MGYLEPHPTLKKGPKYDMILILGTTIMGPLVFGNIFRIVQSKCGLEA